MQRLLQLLSTDAPDRERIRCARKVVSTALKDIERSEQMDAVHQVLTEAIRDDGASGMLRWHLREQFVQMLRAMERRRPRRRSKFPVEVSSDMDASAHSSAHSTVQSAATSEDEWFDASDNWADFESSQSDVEEEASELTKWLTGEARDLRRLAEAYSDGRSRDFFQANFPLFVWQVGWDILSDNTSTRRDAAEALTIMAGAPHFDNSLDEKELIASMLQQNLLDGPEDVARESEAGIERLLRSGYLDKLPPEKRAAAEEDLSLAFQGQVKQRPLESSGHVDDDWSGDTSQLSDSADTAEASPSDELQDSLVVSEQDASAISDGAGASSGDGEAVVAEAAAAVVSTPRRRQPPAAPNGLDAELALKLQRVRDRAKILEAKASAAPLPPEASRQAIAAARGGEAAAAGHRSHRTQVLGGPRAAPRAAPQARQWWVPEVSEDEAAKMRAGVAGLRAAGRRSRGRGEQQAGGKASGAEQPAAVGCGDAVPACGEEELGTVVAGEADHAAEEGDRDAAEAPAAAAGAPTTDDAVGAIDASDAADATDAAVGSSSRSSSIGSDSDEPLLASDDDAASTEEGPRATVEEELGTGPPPAAAVGPGPVDSGGVGEIRGHADVSVQGHEDDVAAGGLDAEAAGSSGAGGAEAAVPGDGSVEEEPGPIAASSVEGLDDGARSITQGSSAASAASGERPADPGDSAGDEGERRIVVDDEVWRWPLSLVGRVGSTQRSLVAWVCGSASVVLLGVAACLAAPSLHRGFGGGGRRH